MAAPTFVSVNTAPTGGWGNNSTPAATGSFAVQSGDILIAIAFAEHDSGNAEITIATTTGSDPTWVQQQERQPNSSNEGYASLWSGVAPTTQNVVVTFTRTGGTRFFGGEVHVWRDSDGLGNTAQNNNGTGSGSPTVNITTTQADSGLSAGSNDWNAAGAGTWTTTAGAVVERADFHDAAHYDVHTATYADVDAVGSKTVGLSAPTTQRYQIVVAEIKGTAAGGTAHAGAATFAGVGNLSIETQKTKIGEGDFDGVGNLSVSARQVHVQGATFAGAGSLSADENMRLAAAAVLAGLGNLSADENLRMAALATFAGAGSFSADANKPSKIGEATFSGAGSFSARITGRLAIAASFAGISSFSVNINGRLAVAATFVGSGSLSALASQQAQGDVSEQIWSVEGEEFLEPVDDFIDTGPQFEPRSNAHQGEATFAGAGSLSVAVRLNLRIAATFNGAGNLLADAQQAGVASGQAMFNGAGGLSVNVTQRHVQGATFVGAGNLSVNVTARLVGAATFQGAGNMSALVDQLGTHFGFVAFAGSSNLSVNTTQRHVQGATFNGAGSLSVYAGQGNRASAIFGGLGNLSIDAAKFAAQNAGIFNGSGLLSASTISSQAALASFNGVGNFSISIRAGYAVSVQFTGTGNLLCSVVTRQSAAARFNGLGNLSVHAGSRLQVAARFAGAGSFSSDTLYVPFGFNFISATFNGDGGMIADTLQFGPRHVSSRVATATLATSRPGASAQTRPQPLPTGRRRRA